jgi:hypothetical protein
MSTRKRWPNGAEHNRQDAIDAVKSARALQGEAQALLDKSQQHTKTNPQLKEMMDLKIARLIAESGQMLADALRFLEEAKHGS